MALPAFDDSSLDDPVALQAIDDQLRQLASAGARVRVLGDAVHPAAGSLLQERPRGVIALGAEARLVRAMLEPVCPVPFVAWPTGGLPGWVGPLDLVVVLASEGSEPDLMSAVAEAVRRGASLLVAANPDSPIAEQAASRSTLVLPTGHSDPLATVVVTLEVLHELGLGPAVSHERVARQADLVAQECSPHRDLAQNPAKDLAVALAEAQPLVWGGSVLAARAARRIAEALRRASGRPALSADATALLPVLEACTPRDPFLDPFDEDAAALPCVLVVIDDGNQDERIRRQRGELTSLAERRGVRVCEIASDTDDALSGLDRYVELLQRGRYAASYLALGLADDERG
ncbi:SIS domain-containing protein [Luteococcus sp. H138]|uniref:SIS domain-containing protein n=1 Tax=unclassified Luteococcus TaxID=2639923 RepID=UPI00313DFF20